MYYCRWRRTWRQTSEAESEVKSLVPNDPHDDSDPDPTENVEEVTALAPNDPLNDGDIDPTEKFFTNFEANIQIVFINLNGVFNDSVVDIKLVEDETKLNAEITDNFADC